jgi:nucleoside 2-deoxyribosyltransferase
MSAYGTALSESSKEEILAEALRQHDRANRLEAAGKTNSIPRIYIAGPFTAKTRWEEEQNVRQAEAIGYAVAQLGAYPVIPHTNTRPLFIDLQTPEWWYITTLESMFTCDAVLLTVDWRKSAGARNEKEQAEKKGIPVFESITNLYAWLVDKQIKSELLGLRARPDDGRVERAARVLFDNHYPEHDHTNRVWWHMAGSDRFYTLARAVLAAADGDKGEHELSV